MKYPNPLNLSIKALKTWNGQEGGGFTFTLLADGKPVANVRDDAMGGDISVEAFITDAMRRKQDMAAFRAANKLADDIHRKIIALCKTLPTERYDDMDLPVSSDSYLTELVSAYEIEKKMARHRVKGTLFRLPGDKHTEFRSLTILDTVKAKAWLDNKFGAGKYTLV